MSQPTHRLIHFATRSQAPFNNGPLTVTPPYLLPASTLNLTLWASLSCAPRQALNDARTYMPGKRTIKPDDVHTVHLSDMRVGSTDSKEWNNDFLLPTPHTD